jgi:hypothetical protein
VPADKDDKDMWSIDWKNSGCEQGAQWGARSCPHIEPNWPYTVNDAFSALACQVGGTDGSYVRQLIRAVPTVFCIRYVHLNTYVYTEYVDAAGQELNRQTSAPRC